MVHLPEVVGLVTVLLTVTFLVIFRLTVVTAAAAGDCEDETGSRPCSAATLAGIVVLGDAGPRAPEAGSRPWAAPERCAG